MAELVDTNSATAKASDILQGETAYVKSGLVTGTIPKQAGSTVVPGTASKTVVERGKYMVSDIVMVGDASLKPENIAKGVTLFGVKGTWEGEPPPPTLPDGFYEISVQSSPNESGTVYGGGVASHGTTITVTAEPNDWYYEFSEWEENGQPVSKNSDYMFTVGENRNLTATFESIPHYKISATAEPEESGVVTGTGAYPPNGDVILTAKRNVGWLFDKWEEAGSTISNGAEYSFTADRDRNLVAKFKDVMDGYTKIEYIETTGKRYIDTGVTAQSGTVVYLDFYPTDASGGPYVFGGYVAVSGTYYEFGIRIISNTEIRFYCSTSSTLVTDTNILRRASASLEMGEVYRYSYDDKSGSGSVSNFHSSIPIYLFADVAASVPSRSMKGRLYSCKISKNGILFRDFVPCISPDGIVGLMDLVGGIFYPGKGTEDFIAGPPVD